MNLSYTVSALVRSPDGATVTITLQEVGGEGRVVATLPSNNPAIAQLTIGRQVNATFQAV